MPESAVDAGVEMSSRAEIAREALHEFAPASQVGALVSEETDDDGVTTLTFAATMLGYPGWHWTVSVVQLEGDEPTVLEAELLPGDGALLAPDWVPWSVRLEEYKAAQAAEAAERAAAGEPDEDADDADDDDFGGESEDDDADDEGDDAEDDEDSDDDGFGDADEHGEDFGDDVYDGLDPESAVEHAESDDAESDGAAR
ncbi:DUF3027 domain-containing protein [Schumannella sp. 10F1B-5-1]|uniref:DUF3027 domain-containing protein n=1 Tax=Schumannella sp. 10F1B-5-1 TaxID=2590780 RepID=UPI00210682BA|nr:DUF3027 domain-containing protein [Schumannella sp. 10F1B-5-1]